MRPHATDLRRSAHHPGLRRQGEAGFTLIELLLATAIAAVVLLVINTTFFAALRLHNTTHEKIDEDLMLQRALAIVRKDLAGIVLPGNPQSTNNTFAGQLVSEATSTNDLDGTGQRITPDIYTTSGTIDGWTPFSEVQMVSYYLAPAADGAATKDLVRVVTRNLLPVSEPSTEDQRLLTGVRAASISYYDGSAWTDAWDSTDTRTLPTAIAFSVTMEPRDAAGAALDPSPVEIVVPVLVTTTTSAQEAAAASADSGGGE